MRHMITESYKDYQNYEMDNTGNNCYEEMDLNL